MSRMSPIDAFFRDFGQWIHADRLDIHTQIRNRLSVMLFDAHESAKAALVGSRMHRLEQVAKRIHLVLDTLGLRQAEAIKLVGIVDASLRPSCAAAPAVEPAATVPVDAERVSQLTALVESLTTESAKAAAKIKDLVAENAALAGEARTHKIALERTQQTLHQFKEANKAEADAEADAEPSEPPCKPEPAAVPEQIEVPDAPIPPTDTRLMSMLKQARDECRKLKTKLKTADNTITLLRTRLGDLRKQQASSTVSAVEYDKLVIEANSLRRQLAARTANANSELLCRRCGASSWEIRGQRPDAMPSPARMKVKKTKQELAAAFVASLETAENA